MVIVYIGVYIYCKICIYTNILVVWEHREADSVMYFKGFMWVGEHYKIYFWHDVLVIILWLVDHFF